MKIYFVFHFFFFRSLIRSLFVTLRTLGILVKVSVRVTRAITGSNVEQVCSRPCHVESHCHHLFEESEQNSTEHNDHDDGGDNNDDDERVCLTFCIQRNLVISHQTPGTPVNTSGTLETPVETGSTGSTPRETETLWKCSAIWRPMEVLHVKSMWKKTLNARWTQQPRRVAITVRMRTTRQLQL